MNNTKNSKKLWKAHGLGNDYLVWEEGEPLNSNMVQQVCHRHRGFGGDGILEPIKTERADLGVRIWNPDGSVAEKSGNGLRIFAWWAVHRRQMPRSFSVDTGTDIVFCEVKPEENWVKIDMGTAKFAPQEIPCTVKLWGNERDVVGEKLALWTVSIGNPHCVSFFNKEIDLDQLNWRVWGAALEKAAIFPNRINVQFAKIVDRNNIDIRIWERGAGETSASGSSSCAVAVIAYRMGWIDENVTMHMPGGELSVRLSSDFSIQLQGPVEVIGVLEWWI